MKILMINSVCGVGSTGRICTDLAQTLEEQGNEVKIAYGREKVSEEYKHYAVRIGNDLDTRIHGIRARAFDQAGLGSRRATKEFIEWVDQFNPDVIHLHNLHGYYIHVPTLFEYLKENNKRVIWTLHDSWAFSGHSGTCDKVECKKWKNGCGNCPLKKQYPSSYIDRSKANWIWKRRVFSGLNDLTIVTPSRWLAEETKESFLGGYNVRVIPNGIDTNLFSPHDSDIKNKIGISGKKMILGVSNSWHKYKGLYDFYELNKMIDKDKYTIVLVGVTDKQRKEVPEGIIAITKTRDVEELVDYYSAADVFVNLTYCDTFPTVNLEAQACGCMVFTYSTGGSPESVDNRFGKVIERGNLQEIVNSISRIPLERTAQKKMIEETRKTYSKEVTARKYLKLY